MVDEALNFLNEIVVEKAPEMNVGKHRSPAITAYVQNLRGATEIDATVIIMGAHRPSPADCLSGPTTARVVRHAECPENVLRTVDEKDDQS